MTDFGLCSGTDEELTASNDIGSSIHLPLANAHCSSLRYPQFCPCQHLAYPLLPRPKPPKMRSLISLILALAALVSLISATGLEIEVTESVECTRKTKKGDNVDMHYRGTLASDGSEFDASYNRGTPLSFQIGAGRVIKG